VGVLQDSASLGQAGEQRGAPPPGGSGDEALPEGQILRALA
jgi:hypothetical protein